MQNIKLTHSTVSIDIDTKTSQMLCSTCIHISVPIRTSCLSWKLRYFWCFEVQVEEAEKPAGAWTRIQGTYPSWAACTLLLSYDNQITISPYKHVPQVALNVQVHTRQPLGMCLWVEIFSVRSEPMQQKGFPHPKRYIECLTSGKNKNILKLWKKPVVAGNQIQGTCFELPVLHYGAMTTGQPAALTILYKC